MKEIMAKESSTAPQGVATFAYSPADKRFPVLFEYARPFEELKDVLMVEYAGLTLTLKDIFNRHNVGTPFILKNYKSAISDLDNQGKVSTNRTDQHKKRNQCPEHIVVTFPRSNQDG